MNKVLWSQKTLAPPKEDNNISNPLYESTGMPAPPLPPPGFLSVAEVVRGAAGHERNTPICHHYIISCFCFLLPKEKNPFNGHHPKGRGGGRRGGFKILHT